MVGRGGGRRLGNRNVIAPGQLQNIIRSEKGATIKSALTKRVQIGLTTQYDRDVVEMVAKNLDRQRAACMANNVVESPTMNHANLNSAFEEEQVEEGQIEEQQFQEELVTDNHSEGFVNDDRAKTVGVLEKRKRMTRLASRVAVSLQVNQAADPLPRNTSTNHDVDEQQAPTNGCSNENEVTSKTRARGSRGKYKSFVVDMKIKGKGSKLNVEIPDEIDREFGENSRHLVNECGRVVRTKAPLNVKNWQEALSIAGDSMWKEIQEKFQVNDANHLAKMYTFVVDTMQRLYRLWKCRLHYYYKSAKCGKTNAERLNNPPLDLPKEQWQWCVEHYGSDEFKIVSQRNSKNRLSDKRCIHTTGNLAFVEVEDILTKENDGVKPTADVIWLVQHTHTNKEDKLEWADGTRSKIIHEKLKNVVATVGDSMTQEEILIQVLEPRSGYVRGKGTALRGYYEGKQQLEQRRLVEQQQQKIQEQEQRIKELEESHQKQQQELEDCKQRQQQELEEHKAQQQQAMEDFKRELLQQLANRGI